MYIQEVSNLKKKNLASPIVKENNRQSLLLIPVYHLQIQPWTDTINLSHRRRLALLFAVSLPDLTSKVSSHIYLDREKEKHSI